MFLRCAIIRINYLTTYATILKEKRLHKRLTIYAAGDRNLYAHFLAHMQWYGYHPKRNYMHLSVIICAAVFDSEPCASFMPVNRIPCHCAVSSPLSLNFDYGADHAYYAIVSFVRYALLE